MTFLREDKSRNLTTLVQIWIWFLDARNQLSEAMAAGAGRRRGEPCGVRSSRFKIWRTVRGALAGCR
jgi:hypothetical protein